MSPDATRYLCPKCKSTVDPTSEQCGNCTYTFRRMCPCGASYLIFDRHCPSCGQEHRRMHRRKSKRFTSRFRDLSEALAEGVTGPFATWRRHRARRSHRRPSSPRASCPACGAVFEGRAETCPGCGVELMSICRCGAKVHRVVDARCPSCGKLPHFRRKVRRRIWVTVLSILAGAAVIAGVAVESYRRDPTRRRRAYLEAANPALAHRQWAEAAKWLTLYVRDNPGDALNRYRLGVSLFWSGRREEGTDEVHEALKIEPDLDEALVFLAGVEIEAGNRAEAIRLLERSVAREPRPANAFLMLGRLYVLEGRAAEGIESLANGMEGDWDVPPVEEALLLGDLLAERGALRTDRRDTERARALYQRVVDWVESESGREDDPVRDSIRARAYFGLGEDLWGRALQCARVAERGLDGAAKADMIQLQARIFHGRNEFEQAAQLATRALETDPSPARHVSLGRLWRGLGRPDEELAVLEAGRQRYPDDVGIIEAWAARLTREGRAGEAAEALAEIEKRLGAPPEIQVIRGRTLRRAGREEEALAVFRAAREAHPERNDVLLEELSARVDSFGRMGDERPEAEWDALKAELERTLRDVPESSAALTLRAKVLLYEGRSIEAKGYLREATERDPLDIDAAIWLGLSYYRSGEYEEAIAKLGGALRRTQAELPRPRLVLADCHFRIEDYARAEEITREILGRVPGERAARQLLARALLAEDRLDDARQEFERLQTETGGDVDSALYLGWLSLRTGRSDKAEDAFGRARSLAKTPEEEHKVTRVVAEYYRQMKRDDAAIGTYESYVSSNPDQLDGRIGLADFLFAMGRKKEALAAYLKCLTIEPAHVGVRRRICEFYFEEGTELAEAERQIGEIERLAPDAPDLHYLRGKLEVLKGRLKEGIEALENYLVQRPEDPDGLYSLGTALAKDGRYEEAVERLEAANALVPNSPAVRLALGQVLQARTAELYRKNDLEAVRKLGRRALGYNPGLSDTRFMAADAMFKLGEMSGAETECLRALQRDPDNLPALRLLGTIRVARGDLKEAVDALVKATQVSDNKAYDHYVLAALYLRLYDYPNALEEAERAAVHSENPLHAADVKVEALIRMNETGRALEFVNGLRDKALTDPLVHLLRARVYRARKDVQKALEAYQAALQFDKSYHVALWEYIDLVFEKRGDFDQAMQEARYRYEEAPDEPELNYIMAWLHVQALQREEALPYLERTLELNPWHRSAAMLYAKVTSELGKPDLGRDALRRILEKNDRDAEVWFLLGMAYDRDGEVSLAMRQYERAIAVNRNHAYARNNLAMHLLTHPGGAVAVRQALAHISAALAVAPDNPVFLDTHGRVQMASGSLSDARHSLKRAWEGFKRYYDGLQRKRIEGDDRRADALRTKMKEVEKSVKEQLEETEKALEELDEMDRR